MFNLDEGKIVSFLGALFLSPASYVLKKIIEYIGAWWLPVRKANLAFETGVKFFITIGEVPSADEINMLKSEISKRYNIPVCQIDDIYTTIVHIYTKSICSEQLSNQEKEEIRSHIFRQGTRYREQNIVYKTEGAEFMRDVLFTMMVVFLIGVINFLGLGKMIDSFDLIIWVIYSFFSALIFNMGFRCIFDPCEEKWRKKRALESITELRNVCRQRKIL